MEEERKARELEDEAFRKRFALMQLLQLIANTKDHPGKTCTDATVTTDANSKDFPARMYLSTSYCRAALFHVTLS